MNQLLSAIKVLLIDTEDEIVEAAHQYLDRDYDYVLVRDDEEALSFLAENKDQTALILINMDSTGEDGLSLLRQMAEMGYMQEIPVIPFAETTSESLMETVTELGAVDFLSLCESGTPEKRIKNKISVFMRNKEREVLRAETDAVTGALNLAGLRRRFISATKNNPDKIFIFVFSDLKNFKYINSVFGIGTGNEILRTWVEIIKKYLPTEESLLCRVGGDQVVFVLAEDRFATHEQHFHEVLEEFRAAFAGRLGDYTLNVVSGAYIYDPQLCRGETFTEIMGYAKQAQKTIKANVASGVAIFDDELWEHQQRRIEIAGHLDSALEKGEISVYLQPQYNYASREILGAECLCRWRHPKYGAISPAEFIPVLEDAGQIYKLDYFVWEEACKLIRKWQDEGRPMRLSVNVSKKDMDGADLPVVFAELVSRYDIDPQLLHIEITESVYMTEASRMIDLVHSFSKQGFCVEMDDFGSGFSSLNLLHTIDVDVLKLDMGFLRDAGLKDKGGNIINAVVRMAHSMGCYVLAEGVETDEQAEFLKNLGCIMMQGYLFAKPLTIAEFEVHRSNVHVSEQGLNYVKAQLFNIAELFDKKSSGYFIFNNCIGSAVMFERNGDSLKPVITNNGFANIMQWKREDIDERRGEVFADISENNRAILLEQIDRAKENGKASGVIRSKRSGRWFRVNIRVVSNWNGVEMYLAELFDITKERQLEVENSWYQEKIKAIMETPGVIIYEYDVAADSMMFSVRTGTGELHEHSSSNYLTELPKNDWIHKESVPKYMATLNKVIEEGCYATTAVDAKYLGGVYHKTRYHFTPVKDEKGKVYRILGRAERMTDEDYI